VSLRRILDQDDACPVGAAAQGVHVGHLAVKVHHDHRCRPGRDDRLELCGREQQCIGAHIREHWRSPGEDNGFGRRDERVGGNDDVVADTDLKGPESQQQRIGPAAHANRVRYTAVGRPPLLEILDRFTAYEPARPEQPRPRLLHVGANVARHRHQVRERYVLAHRFRERLC
jgi:hypothetical protein